MTRAMIICLHVCVAVMQPAHVHYNTANVFYSTLSLWADIPYCSSHVQQQVLRMLLYVCVCHCLATKVFTGYRMGEANCEVAK